MITALLHPSERALWPGEQTLHAFVGSSAVLVDNRKESNEELEKDWVIWHKQGVLQEIRKDRDWGGLELASQSRGPGPWCVCVWRKRGGQ